MKIFKNTLVQVITIIFILISGGFLALYYQSIIERKVELNSTKNKSSSLVVQTVASSLISESTEVHSPDGTLKLLMEFNTNKDNSKKYTFSISDIKGNNQHQIFSTVLSSGYMSLPENSWSPDNSYFFIQENDNKSKNIFVFKSSGDSFIDNQPYLNVNLLFSQKINDYSFYDATGWASPTLLIIYTMKNQTEKGPFYWFEVPSQSFIQLAH